MTLTRDVPLVPGQSALLFVDVQNFCARRDGAEFKDLAKPEFDEKYGWFFDQLESRVVANMQRLQAACRKAGVEVMYTTIESLTRDGRDRSLDYKLSGMGFPKGSRESQVIPELAPRPDEMVLPKTSSSVFSSTPLDYLLRNIGIEDVFVTGYLTDQCIDHAVKDGADRGYFMTCVHDACAAETEARHAAALQCFQGYCRTLSTEGVLDLIP